MLNIIVYKFKLYKSDFFYNHAKNLVVIIDIVMKVQSKHRL